MLHEIRCLRRASRAAAQQGDDEDGDSGTHGGTVPARKDFSPIAQNPRWTTKGERMKRICVILSMLLAALPSTAGAGPERQIGDTSLWTRIGAPGMPEGIAVRDGVVYVSTHVSARGNAGAEASKIFRFDLETKQPLGAITVSGQTTSGTHGLLSIAFDASGRLYVLDRNPSRVVRIDLTSGEQETYASFPELPTCRPVIGPSTNCAPVTVDEPNFVDYLAFDGAGNAYVTDLQAATIWRVPPNGIPEIWFQDARLDSIFGPNGIAVDAAGTTIYFAMTGSNQPTSPTQGIIYTLPIKDAPVAADLKVFHTFLTPASGPDGIAFGASGKLYVALAGSNQVAILNPDGTEFAIFPNAVSNQMQEVPYDLPASVAFDGNGSLLVTNQSFFTATESHWAVLDAWVGDTAQPLIEPPIA